MTTSPAVGAPFRVCSIGARLGSVRIDVAERYPQAAGLVDRTGIPVVWESPEDAYALAVGAAREALEGGGRPAGEVDAILYVTQSPVWHLPSHACRLQHDLGLSTHVLALDVGQGCSGFVQALTLAVGLLERSKAVLIVTADAYRAKLDPEDRGTQAIFSDGAAAVLVASSSPTHVIAAESHLTEGSGADLLVQRAWPAVEALSMSGRDVYLFTRRVVQGQLRATLDRAGVSMDEVDAILLHQASKPVIDAVIRDLAGCRATIPTNLATRGNTVSSTIPMLMADTALPGHTDTALLCGFGVGLSCSTLLLVPASAGTGGRGD